MLKLEVLNKRSNNCLQDVPNPVALEPCAGNKAAVLTLLVRQPTGNDRYTPHGYSGTIHYYYLQPSQNIYNRYKKHTKIK